MRREARCTRAARADAQERAQELASILQFVASQRGDAGADARRVQTFVFSATLTLPPALRRRVRRGGGGASGSASLDALMASLAFRDKPLVADLTSARRLADRARPAPRLRGRRPRPRRR